MNDSDARDMHQLAVGATPHKETNESLPELPRTPADFAIEHAEYMAASAERLVSAVQEHAAAHSALVNDGDDPDSDEDITSLNERCDRADELVGDAMRSVTNRVYEFRKRRDRALQAIASLPQREAVATAWYLNGELNDLEGDPTAAPLPDGEYQLYPSYPLAVELKESKT